MRPIRKSISCVTFTLLLSGCMVGPDYKQPQVSVPAKFKEAPKGWKVACPQDTFDRGKWWQKFHDAQLNALEEKLNITNQTVAVAVAQYEQARALVDEARAGLYPTLTGDVAVTRQRTVSSGSGSTSFTSASAGGVTTSSRGSSSNVFNSHSWALDAAWEPDLWGSVRRSIEANAAGAEASAASLASVRLSSQATLAQTYFQLRALDTDQKLLDRTVRDYRETWQLTKNQYASGVAARSDVIQAQSQLENARAAAINNHLARAQFEHAIAVLIGEPPANFAISFKPLVTQPPSIPVTVPSILLERRPDVAQAEREVAQANAQIGVAIAAYFPSLSLTGAVGEQNLGFAHWFSVPMLNWSLGSQLSETIFDGGLRSATVAAARANYRATVGNYRQVVLAAFQDVEDNLVSLRVLKQQGVQENMAAADARRALQLVINQYKSGTVAYSSVITAQIAAFTAEKTAADIVGQRMTSAVGLVKALGGGWDTTDIPKV